ncbi:MAG: sirohydrochlorin chelatase, partial [Frankiales bacterium]|nr:sirohydrochlorin chelatase [Frankiales bacterium]
MPAALPFPTVRPTRSANPQVCGPRPAGPPPLLLVGHGTRCLPGERQFEAFVGRVTARLARRGVDAAGGLIELAPPPVTDAAADLVARGHHEVIAVPLMLFAAGHAKGDIPAALAREAQRYPGLSYRYAAVIGPDPLVLAALNERLAAVLPAQERAGAYVVLVGRGATDPDANSEVARAARLLLEHSWSAGDRLGGVETAFVSLAGPGVPAALERCRLLGATRVIVLPLFMFTGVLPRRIISQAQEWAGGHPEITVSCAEVIGDCEQL